MAPQIDGFRLFLRAQDNNVAHLMRDPQVAAAAERALADARAGRLRSSHQEGSRERDAQQGSGRKRSCSGALVAEEGRDSRGVRRGRGQDRSRSRDRSPTRSHALDGARELRSDAPLVPVCVRHFSGVVDWQLCSTQVFVR